MTREFVRMPEFERGWQSAGLCESDILDLEIALCQNPSMGDLVQGTGGLRKIRWAIRHKGKSGGMRVVYVDFVYLKESISHQHILKQKRTIKINASVMR